MMMMMMMMFDDEKAARCRSEWIYNVCRERDREGVIEGRERRRERFDY